MISLNSFKREVKFHQPIIFLLAILQIEAIIALKQWNIYFVSNLNTQAISHYSVEITNHVKLHLPMASSMRFPANTEILILGNFLLIYSITWQQQRLLMGVFYAFMVVCHPILRHLTKYALLTARQKSHMMVHSAISCGVILMIQTHGRYLQEEQDGYLVGNQLMNSVELMDCN